MSRWQLTWSTASSRSATVSTRVGRIRIGSMLARRLLRCRPTRKGRCTQRGRTSRAREIVGRSTTWGCGTTVADRPQRDSISRAAPGVSVTTASAAGTSTSSCSSWRRRSVWCGLRRSWTVNTKGLPRPRTTRVRASRSSGRTRRSRSAGGRRRSRPCVPSRRPASPAATTWHRPAGPAGSGRGRGGVRSRGPRAARGGGRRRARRARRRPSTEQSRAASAGSEQSS